MKIKLDKKTKKKILKTFEDWLDARVIGGTTISAIMNKSKYQTPNDVYNELVFKTRKKVNETTRMALGRENEAVIANLFANDFKDEYEVINQPKGKYWIFNRKDKPYITCTPDRLLINKITGELEGLEIKDIELLKKCDKEIWENDELPVYYLLQCIWYFVTFPNMKKVTLFPNLKFYKYENKQKVYEYSLHKRYTLFREECEKLIELCERNADEFWNNNVLKRQRPQTIIHL